MLINVTRRKTKTKMVTVKCSPITYAEFQAACLTRGVSMAGLLHFHMIQTIREERDHSPGIFAQTLAQIYRQALDAGELDIDDVKVGSAVTELDASGAIRNLEDVKKAARRKSSPPSRKKRKKSA